jgi:cold shock CspA family protein/ribosome-associated translation inhibitor RaiA
MLPVQIAVHNTQLSPDAEGDIRQRVERLSRYYGRLMSCRVTVDVPQSRRRTDAVLYGVRIDVTVPGGEIVVNHQPRAELATALDGAFKAMRRRLQDYARRQRGAVKAHEPPALATVSEYYPLGGYGFLEALDGKRVYFDRHAVLDNAFDRLDIGTEVRFTEEEGERGPQATTVVLVAPPHLATQE